jgi:UDP-N-acetylmuramoyl-tripeptide--D-alanyl-D-alanine ligase
MEIALSFVTALAFMAFFLRRQLVYLHLFQQDEYDNGRFLKGLFERRLFDRKASLVALAATLVGLVPGVPGLVPHMALVVGFVALAATETDPRVVGKKKLAMTARAKRIYWLSAGCMLPVVALSCLSDAIYSWLVPVQLIPTLLTVANLLLSPFENRIQRKYWLEASDKLKQLQPTIIGITGSYGKSTVKHIFGHILSTVDSTLITPGSINTSMGISRIVREKLQRHHKFFVVEMGAYGPGSISRLCELSPPHHGIVTAIGPAHYERFKSLDAVARTKFELGEAVLAANGKLMVAESCRARAPAREFCDAHPDTVVLTGESDDAACRIVSTRQTREGTEVDLAWRGESFSVKAPLYGPHQAGNICLAFAAACTLGVPPQTAVLALKGAPQVSHRLEVRRQSDGITIVDDAYNSNPEGFASALELLSVLVEPGGRRILVTPGIVELGEIHDEVHGRLGAVAARHVDVLVPVLPDRIRSFISAFEEAASGASVVPCATFAAASDWMAGNLRAGDIVLLENDLPDLYESNIRL